MSTKISLTTKEAVRQSIILVPLGGLVHPNALV